MEGLPGQRTHLQPLLAWTCGVRTCTHGDIAQLWSLQMRLTHSDQLMFFHFLLLDELSVLTELFRNGRETLSAPFGLSVRGRLSADDGSGE